ncbi:hypothetical protein C8Q80DRAFT_1172955 [Daedaleopsis nitida]|nr:hypothetical protein C8Q80DRAFT_1172955 [Daedaleopsis nitida]
MNLELPQELLDQVIDQLRDDTKALAACALASHACLPSARTHLFHDQRLIGGRSCDRFEAFLDSCPDVTRYIRTLSVTEPTSTSYAQSWVSRVPVFVARLERLDTLELVSLHYLAAFGKLTRLVCNDVYFDHFLDVQTFLSAACNAKDLRFHRVGWGNNTPPAYPMVPTMSPLRLRRLLVDSWAASSILRGWLLPSADLGDVDIRSLLIRWRERDSMDVLDALFRVCGPALQNLYVELPTTIEAAQNTPTLRHNTNLRTLEIDGLVLPGSVAWTSALLAELRSTQLEKLSISMLVLRNDVLPCFEWTQLDEFLARSAYIDVVLAITVNRALHPQNNPSQIRAAVMKQLPRAVQRGKLAISCS